MKLFKYLVLLLVQFFIYFVCYSQDQLVTVTGEAIISNGNTMGARQEALTDAFRKAVEKGVGTFVVSGDTHNNFAKEINSALTSAPGGSVIKLHTKGQVDTFTINQA